MKQIRYYFPATVLLLSAVITQAADDPMSRGKEQFEYWCATCHGPGLYEGRYLPGTASLQQKYNGQLPAALENRTDLAAEYIKVVIRQGSEGMPSFRKTEISDSQMQDIADYLSRRR